MKPQLPESRIEGTTVMLLIACPWCGSRDEIEFVCGGQSHITRPEPYDQVTDEAWGDYLFFRDNPKGNHQERWHHSFGCRQWFNVVRSTVTHKIIAVYRMGESAPDTAESVAVGGVE